MMEKEFNLSELVQYLTGRPYYPERKVKEFIKRIKAINILMLKADEDCCPSAVIRAYIKEIDKLAGDKLT